MTWTEGAALIVSIIALVVSGVAVKYSRRQAVAAQDGVHRAYRPILTVTLEAGTSKSPDVLYKIRNDGQKDLDSVVVERPLTAGSVHYRVARLGSDYADEAELGPLSMGAAALLSVAVGHSRSLPEFRVRITCRAGGSIWTLSELLEPRKLLPDVP